MPLSTDKQTAEVTLFSFGFDVSDKRRLNAGASGLVNHSAFVSAVREQLRPGERDELPPILLAVLADPLSLFVKAPYRHKSNWRCFGSVFPGLCKCSIGTLIGSRAVETEKANELFFLLRRQQGDSLKYLFISDRWHIISSSH